MVRAVVFRGGMRREDEELLARAFGEGETTAKRLGTWIEPLDELRRSVIADMTVEARGVSWWQPFLDAEGVAVVSDHLVQCMNGVEANLLEARLHQMELEHWAREESNWVSQPMRYDARGRPLLDSFRHPRATSPADERPRLLLSLHTAGFFRATNSTLDCLAGVVVGVLGLKTSLLMAGMPGVRRHLAGLRPQAPALHRDFATELEQTIVDAGPPEWLKFTDHMRNMLTHRGRRFMPATIEPRSEYTGLVDGAANPVRAAQVVHHLPREPKLPDVAMMEHRRPLTISEPTEQTVSGILGSVHELCAIVSSKLDVAWSRRRDAPEPIPQPQRHWEGIREGDRCDFPGFAPDEERYGKPDTIRVSPGAIDRFVMAGVFNTGEG